MTRPLILVQTSPQETTQDGNLVISARLYDRETLLKRRVKKIYMNIVSLDDGHEVWPNEVVRKNDWKMDIQISTKTMKPGHDYLVRISNNENQSPQGSAEFKISKGGGSPILIAPVALPLGQSMLSIVTKAIEENFSPDEIDKFLRNMFPDMDSNEIRRLKDRVQDEIRGQLHPVDDITKQMIEKKKFVTQMDSRVCPLCLEASEGSSDGLDVGEYFPDDPSAPEIPVHFNCRCTYDIIFTDKRFEAALNTSFYEVAQVWKQSQILPDILKAVDIISRL